MQIIFQAPNRQRLLLYQKWTCHNYVTSILGLQHWGRWRKKIVGQEKTQKWKQEWFSKVFAKGDKEGEEVKEIELKRKIWRR